MKIQKVSKNNYGTHIVFESNENIKINSYIGVTIKGEEYYYKVIISNTNNSKIITYEASEVPNLQNEYKEDIRDLIGTKLYEIKNKEKLDEIYNQSIL